MKNTKEIEYIVGAVMGGLLGIIGTITKYLPITIVGGVLFLIFIGLIIYDRNKK